MKIRDSRGKSMLRRVLYNYDPAARIDRPRAGFGLPLGDWLRGPLQEWAEAVLDPTRVERQGYLNSRIEGEAWRSFLGVASLTERICSVLMFQLWAGVNS